VIKNLRAAPRLGVTAETQRPRVRASEALIDLYSKAFFEASNEDQSVTESNEQ
jgi:hypothetical protein